MGHFQALLNVAEPLVPLHPQLQDGTTSAVQGVGGQEELCCILSDK